MSTTGLVFLDFDTVLPTIPEKYIDVLSSNNVICLSPAADYWAEKKGIKYQRICAHVDSLYLRKKGDENFGVADTICKELTAILLKDQNIKNIFSKQDPDPMHGYYYMTKIICDALVIRKEILDRVLGQYRPRSVYYFGDKVDKSYILEEMVLKNKGHLYYKVLNAMSSKYAFSLIGVPINGNRKTAFNSGGILFRLRRLIKKLRIFLTNMLYFPGINPKGILLLSQPSDWEKPLELLVKSRAAKVYFMRSDNNNLFAYGGIKYYVTKLPRVLFKKFLKIEFKQNCKEKDLFTRSISLRRPLFPLEDDLFNIMTPFLTDALMDTKWIYLKYFHKTANIFKKKNIRAVISVMVTEPINFMRIRAAQYGNIPVCIFQHGGVGYDYAPLYYWCDEYPSNYMFLYGEAVREYYKSLSLRNGTKYCVTGSSAIDELRKGKKTRAYCDIARKKCIYMLNVFLGNTRYVNRQNYRSDIALWRMQREVVNIFSKHKDWFFIVKPHPDPDSSYNPLVDYIAEQKIGNVIVDTSNNNAEIMRNSDLVILDYLCTGLFEAAALNKDIIVFSGFYTAKSEIEKMLKDATVYLSSDESEFLHLVESFFAKGAVLNTVTRGRYDNFLSEYVTYLNDNKSADRIKDRLTELINSGSTQCPDGVKR